MRLGGNRTAAMLVCASAACTAAAVAPGGANAQPLQCVSNSGQQSTVIVDRSACGSEADATGQAAAFAFDGVGYAKGEFGAHALGIGGDGGVGASQGRGGFPAALGIGKGSVAIASVENGALSLALAFGPSQSLVANADQGVICQGPAAFAWNSLAGLACLSTAIGVWQLH
ncbi:hypothetical protein FOS14_07640 [Skermania sp. ID1734]|uniref:DUF6764 family protein n=1 Tax=Skermania sp. ID1734 TaxID=2597516 RepID=UPI00117CD29B|nr:DUF6764 family protein [Skermania sp. ID1734]TSE00292.1 hypothetical protein FOS14_07640 [Skermania sp. ID1734]